MTGATGGTTGGMKLGVVATSYPRFPGDPAGNFVAAHVAALRALGHRVDVIAAGEPSAPHRPGSPPLDRGAAPAHPTAHRADPRMFDGDPDDDIHRIPSGLFYRGGAPDALERAPLRSGLAAVSFAARLTAVVTARARGWDAIVAHWLAPSALAALPGGRPLTAIAHGGDVFTLRRLGLLAPVLAALARRRALLVFVSAELRDVARRAAPALAGWLDDARVQPMGVDLARLAAVPRQPSDPPLVLCAARLVPIKGVDVAIAAMRHVRAAAHLVIAGDGPERLRLAVAPALAAPAPPSATFLGEVTTWRRDQLLGAASLVVVPSRIAPGGRTEGTPAIALESLAAGVPVVASAVGGLRSLGALPGVELVPPDDPRALAAAIDRCLARSVPPAVMRAAVAHLDWRDVAPRLLPG